VTEFDIELLLQRARGTNSVIKKKPKSKPKPKPKHKTARTRGWGEDTVMSKFYICSVFDETSSTVYVVGGLGATEKLVDKLTKRKRPHQLRTFKHKRLGDRPYRIISYNQKTAYGLRLDELTGWKKIVVLPGTGDFHFLLHNHRGRKAKVKR